MSLDEDVTERSVRDALAKSSQAIDLNGQKITGLGAPSDDNDAARKVDIATVDGGAAHAGVATGAGGTGATGGIAPAFTGTAPTTAVAALVSGTGMTASGQTMTSTDNKTATLNQYAGCWLITATHAPTLIASNTAVTGAPLVLTVLGAAATDAGAYQIVAAPTPAGSVASHTHTGPSHTHVQEA